MHGHRRFRRWFTDFRFLAVKKPPFRIEEEGWGEFDMEIVLTAVDKGGDHSVGHDLNFREEKYVTKHPIVGC